MNAAARILDRLERVKQTGESRWIAACPAHSDKSPSLSIRATEDGRLLLHDFGGCETSAVLQALGLRVSDLFEKPLQHASRPSRLGIPAGDLLELISFELDVAGILLAAIVEGQGCTELAWQRLAAASQRINAARSAVHAR